MRQLSSVTTISTDALDIPIQDGQFASGWIGEQDPRVPTENPRLLKKQIYVHEIYAQPQATQKLVDDSAIDIEQWISERLRDSFTRHENKAFIVGDGKTQPKGILHQDNNIKALKPEEGKLSTKALIDLIYSIDEDYFDDNISFLMHRATLSEVQKLTDDAGKFILQHSLAKPWKQEIFGIPVYCAADMPPINKKAGVIAFGNFRQAYKIVDRNDISIVRDPYTAKPYINYYAVKRVGGDIVDPKAICLLQF